MDVDRVKAVYDVNVFGIFRVTQAFSPLLVHTANTDAYGASRGKGETTVVNVGSLSTVLPAWGGAYASSKVSRCSCPACYVLVWVIDIWYCTAGPIPRPSRHETPTEFSLRSPLSHTRPAVNVPH